jgi:uncharacterized protein YqjF (DUF2071 family)
MSSPTAEDRLAARRPQPNDTIVMYQEWRDLLFLHWEMEADRLASTLPDGLHLDTFEGRAFLGVVPFYMKNVRPRFCPAVGPISNFLEMNVRTYVYDDRGRPGVWFYSLDANQKLAVGLARRLFHLPYQHAEMQASQDEQGWVDYRSHRSWTQVRSRFLYRGQGEPRAEEPGTLEFFLAERYLLFADISGTIWSGQVYHTPYPLQTAEVEVYDDNILLLNGFRPTDRAPDYAHYSAGVKVDIYPIRRV